MTDTIHTVTLTPQEQAAYASGWNRAIEAAEKLEKRLAKSMALFVMAEEWRAYRNGVQGYAEAIRALSMPAPAQAWRVKPLEWTQGTWSGQPAWFADCPFGCWSVVDNGIHGNRISVDDPCGNLHEEDYPTIEAAKAAAQADYAARIFAALIPDTEGGA